MGGDVLIQVTAE